MPIFATGCGLFALGVVLNVYGWRLHERSIMAGEREELSKWFVEILREWFGKLTSQNSTTGERVAAVGAIVAALGLVTAVVGLGVWANSGM